MMNPSRKVHACFLALCVAAGLSLAVPGVLLAKEPLPQTSPEGMQLQHDTDARAVYLMPGATFGQYDRVVIVDAYVEFDKDWQRQYNQDAGGMRSRVTSEDMDRMKAGIAAAFKKVFTEELQANGGYKVVDTPDPTALILKPAIINLQVTAPDLQTSGIDRTLVRSAGEMTLYLELWDPVSNTIMARVMDPQVDDGVTRVATRVTNTAAADRILREWAEKLRKHLDAARGQKGPA